MKAFDRIIVASLPAVPRVVVRRIADRYIAGESLEDAVATVRDLNRDGALATIDVLGEFVIPDEAEATATEYEHALDAARRSRAQRLREAHRARSGDRRPPRARQRRRDRGRHAAGSAASCASTWRTRPTPTRRSSCTARCATRGATTSASSSRPTSSARRADVEALASEGARVRVVKGIYVEPPEVAWRTWRDQPSYLDC